MTQKPGQTQLTKPTRKTRRQMQKRLSSVHYRNMTNKRDPKRSSKIKEKTDDNTEEGEEFKRSMLINSVVITVRDPSKRVKTICKHLRKVLSPDCLFKMEINPKIQDVMDVAQQLLVKQIILISENEIQITKLPGMQVYRFQIVQYEDNFKNFSNDFYKNLPYVTAEGKSSLKQVFHEFGQSEAPSKRIVHFHFKDGLIYLRHFTTSSEDTEENFRLRLREIGPRITLRPLDSDQPAN